MPQVRHLVERGSKVWIGIEFEAWRGLAMIPFSFSIQKNKHHLKRVFFPQGRAEERDELRREKIERIMLWEALTNRLRHW